MDQGGGGGESERRGEKRARQTPGSWVGKESEHSLMGGYAVSGHKLSLGLLASEEVSNQEAPKVLEQHGRWGRGGSLEFKPRMPDVAF